MHAFETPGGWMNNRGWVAAAIAVIACASAIGSGSPALAAAPIGAVHASIGAGSVLTVTYPLNFLPASNDCLSAASGNQTMVSADGSQALVMQTDGNLVLYAVTPTSPASSTPAGDSPVGRTYTVAGSAKWASSTSGAGDKLCYQTDGNLVIYNSAGTVLWYTHTNGTLQHVAIPAALVFGNGSIKLTAQAGTTALPSYTGAFWSSSYTNWTNTALSILPAGTLLGPGQELRSPDRSHRLVYQTDGNLVLYNAAGTATWNTGTNGTSLGFVGLRALDTTSPGAFYGVGYQFAIYPFNTQATTTWVGGGNSTWNTNGNNADLTAAATLELQNDGNLVLYVANSTKQAIWASNTAGT
jgi:hypothetical protein